MERFQSATTSGIDEDHVGRLTTSRTADSVEEVRVTVQEDSIAEKLHMNCESAYSIILKHVEI
jgi:hypothetical protein